MNLEGVKDLVEISHYAAADVAYIQGGGGNTSVKLSDTHMAVKASGCELSQMGDKEGYVVVDYKMIKEYFGGKDKADDDFEEASGQILRDAVVEVEGLKVLRPSVEAGFHALLKKYVIHTHSVYANILACSAEGKGIAEKLFADVDYIWIDYVNPGAVLTAVMAEAIAKFGKVPGVIFLGNHGVIATADSVKEAIDINEMVNNAIRKHLDLMESFPETKVKQIKEGYVESDSSYVSDYFSNEPNNFEFIREKVLYPDQLVYLNNSVYKKDGSQSDITIKDGKVIYAISEKQAKVNEETLVAYLYVINNIKAKGLTLVSMTNEQQAFILGWESEAYRKAMIK